MTSLHALVAVQATPMGGSLFAVEVVWPVNQLPPAALATALEAAAAQLREQAEPSEGLCDCESHHPPPDADEQDQPAPAAAGWRRWFGLGRNQA